SLDLESHEGPARCRSCGFEGPVEVDREALGRILDDASTRGLGPRTMLTPTPEAPEPRLEGAEPPSMLDGPKAPALPQLSPPPVPRELLEGAPPPMEDPRDPLPETKEDAARTRLGDDLDENDRARKRELRARGELLK
ncbi:MAG: hypothetical protein GWN12_06935, partial [Thermoplasmata archaeon]|nr:hypothetical protein [Thermoplasmata archaeon]NIW88513.1 hypothetical protein [Thermoplasmata archaeon]NIY03260.1 hypothetical protein [Thermoplasmata archaeon]